MSASRNPLFHQPFGLTCRKEIRTVFTNQRNRRDESSQPNLAFDSSSQNPRTSVRRQPEWLIQKNALKQSFPTGWNPPKKISRPAMSLLKSLHKEDPHQFSLPILADKFKISPEAVRRILKSNWAPDEVKNDKILNKSGSTGDAWVHHERLETDSIPSDLATSLKRDIKPSSTQRPQFDAPSDDVLHGIWVDPEIRTGSESPKGTGRGFFSNRHKQPSSRHFSQTEERYQLRRHPNRDTRHAFQNGDLNRESHPSSPPSSHLGSAFHLSDRTSTSPSARYRTPRLRSHTHHDDRRS